MGGVVKKIALSLCSMLGYRQSGKRFMYIEFFIFQNSCFGADEYMGRERNSVAEGAS